MGPQPIVLINAHRFCSGLRKGEDLVVRVRRARQAKVCVCLVDRCMYILVDR